MSGGKASELMSKIPDFTAADYQFFFEHIPGFVAIDMNGRVTYITKAICDFCHLNFDTAIGKHIEELFPFSKMMDTIEKKQTDAKTEFYFYQGRFSASTRQPMFRGNKMVGVIEYDIFEDMALVEAFVNHYINLDEELKYFKEEARRILGARYSISDILGKSYVMRDLKEKIRYVARSDSTILLEGETGTGKELVAHAIHNLSKRRFNKFIRINAAGIPESLAESELFGYEPGAFTGADKKGRKGKFELANKGTLFIDEISHMPESLQPKLLRVLQEREIGRIGSDADIPVDVRLVVASNQNLGKLVAEGTLREDLYYRLNVIKISIPPLREHRDDIPVLADHFIGKYNDLFGKQVRRIDDSAIDILQRYDWPGNIRELQNVIERSMNYVESDTLDSNHLDFDLSVSNEMRLDQLEGHERPIEEVLHRAERILILQALKRFDGNKTRTAQYLNISRTLLYQKMKRLGIDP